MAFKLILTLAFLCFNLSSKLQQVLLSKKVDLTVNSYKIFSNCSKQVDQSPDFLGGIQGLHDL